MFRFELHESLAERLHLAEPLRDAPQDCRYPHHAILFVADRDDRELDGDARAVFAQRGTARRWPAP